MRTLNIAMIGFGNAGRAFGKILLKKHQQMLEEMNWDVKVSAIATATRGNLIAPNGIDLAKAINDVEEKGCFDSSWSASSNWNTSEIIKKASFDVLMEITPLEIFSGQPAIENIRTAFIREKHVITANKGPIAWAFRELRGEAQKQGVMFLYETTVMDGAPVFNLFEETLPMCQVTEVKGILNSTTNFILEEMAGGKNLNTAVAEGKIRGFVEADPALDIEGWDAAAKTAALLNALMDGNIKPSEISRQGIQNITYEDIEGAEKRGRVIKLVCHGTRENGQVCGRVQPLEIEKDDILASVKGTSSLVSITTDLMGKITVVEHNPNIEQTGYGLFSDTLRLIRKI